MPPLIGSGRLAEARKTASSVIEIKLQGWQLAMRHRTGMQELHRTLLRIAPALRGWKKSTFEINTINTKSETKENVAHWGG